MTPSPPKSVAVWLFSVWALILLMVLVGGITRLTGSGLSMVEWHPLMGALPPLSEQAWQDVFARYQEFPQYQHVNQWMELSDFKRIFFWEYVHRLLGRLIGVAFFVPWVAFVIRGRLRGAWAWRTFVAFLLGGSQGLLGWFMVKSGLVDRPEVSHFRLAAHLGLAFFVGQWVLWLALDARGEHARGPAPRRLRRYAWAFVALLALQIVFGAFMAGTRAGWLSATFPDMNGYYGPGPFFPGRSVLHDLFYNPLAIHWTHRTLAWLVLAAGAALVWRLRVEGVGAARRAGLVVAHLVALQFLLGVLTVLLHVPTALAVAHQGTAYLLLSASVWLCHRLEAPSSAFGTGSSPPPARRAPLSLDAR